MPTLDWLGKSAVVNHHHDVPFHLLKCDDALSVGDLGSGNLLIQADNLLALKALLPYYAGQVKCIYIDPPYNTGNEKWVYNDNVNSLEIRQWLGTVVGAEAEDLSRHDKWLSMMYPRLSLLWEFLRPDGSLWVSIDDGEAAALRMLLDEVCGRDRFVACNVWQKRYSRENREAIGDVHEYVVVYAKSPQLFKETRNRVSMDAKSRKVYKNPNNDPGGPWRPIPMNAQGYRPNQMYAITAPSGKVFYPPKGRCWSTIEPEFKKLLANGRIYFGKNGNSQPNIIRYLSEVEGFVPWTWWPHEDVGHTDEAKKELYAVLGNVGLFETPKPLRLLKRILEIATNPNDLVLDSYAGSGTTGHAVLSLNKETGKTRHFILVEIDKEICQTVTALRLTRAIHGYSISNEGNEYQESGLGGGFRYCTLGPSLFDTDGQIRAEVTFAELAQHVFFIETGEPLPDSTQVDAKLMHGAKQSPLLGVVNGLAVYLLYNGVLADKSPQGGNVLTRAVLAELPAHAGPKVIYGAGSRLAPERLKREGITFRQTPYEVRVR